MPWAKVDDKLHSHPKAVAAGAAAMGLWVLAMSHCVAYMTDGFVSDQTLALFVDERDGRKARSVLEARANRLASVQLWVRVDGGWRFHDWDKYQPTKERWETEKEALRDRMRRLRAPRVRPHNDDSAPAVRELCATPDPDPIPTRPNPEENPHRSPAGSETDQWGLAPTMGPPAADRPTASPTASQVVPAGVVPKKSKAKRTTPPRVAIEASWVPSEETVARLRELTGSDPQQCLARFREWFIAKGEKRPGWDASFRQWVLRAHERGELRDGPVTAMRPLAPNGKPWIQRPGIGDLKPTTPEEDAAWLAKDAERIAKFREDWIAENGEVGLESWGSPDVETTQVFSKTPNKKVGSQ